MGNKQITNKEWWSMPENMFYGRFIEDDEGNMILNPKLEETSENIGSRKSDKLKQRKE